MYYYNRYNLFFLIASSISDTKIKNKNYLVFFDQRLNSYKK